VEPRVGGCSLWPKMAGDSSDRIDGRGKRKGMAHRWVRVHGAAPALRRSGHRPLVVLLQGFPRVLARLAPPDPSACRRRLSGGRPTCSTTTPLSSRPGCVTAGPGCWPRRWPTYPKSQIRQRPSSHVPARAGAPEQADAVAEQVRCEVDEDLVDTTVRESQPGNGGAEQHDVLSPWAAATAVGDAFFDPLGHERRRRVIRPGRGADA
jgi:hypothetical protein